jgi:ABC-type nitrate/sulfonate/bicarbonate transport system permease component
MTYQPLIPASDIPSTKPARSDRPKLSLAGHKVFGVRAVGWSLLACLVLVWVTVTEAGVQSPLLPAPGVIAAQARTVILSGILPHALAETLSVMLRGYALAALLGVVVGVLMGRFRLAYGAFDPFVELLRPIPITAVVPLLVLFLGIGDTLKVVAIAIGAFFPIVLNAQSGIISVPRTMRETGITFGLSAWKSLRLIYLPYAAPQIFVGLRISISLSLIVAVFSEMVAGNTGIGYFIFNSQQTLDTASLYIGVVVLALLGYSLNGLFRVAERLLLHWHIGLLGRTE